jgi:hypothetical protein
MGEPFCKQFVLSSYMPYQQRIGMLDNSALFKNLMQLITASLSSPLSVFDL